MMKNIGGKGYGVAPERARKHDIRSLSAATPIIRHRPPHIYKDDSICFITAKTIDKIKYFNSDKKKDILSDAIHTACDKFCKDLNAWTILDNHYHILIEINEGKNISRLVNNINANSSRILNMLEGYSGVAADGVVGESLRKHDERALSGATPVRRGRQIWYQYFDRCIRGEKDYWVRFNYVHHNCVKHGYVKSMEEYRYSSYNNWVNEKGLEWMEDVFANYSIRDFSIEGEA